MNKHNIVGKQFKEMNKYLGSKLFNATNNG